MQIQGLTEKEVISKREHYGLNEIRDVHKVSAAKILFRQMRNNFIVYLLVGAAILSFLVEKFITAYTICFVILLVIVTGFIQEYRAEKAIAALKRMIKPLAVVVRNGREQEIPANELVPGDLVLLRIGERIPADCTILESSELRVNESMLTGESAEVSKRPIKNTNDNTSETQLFMGTFIVNGRAQARVISTGMSTKFGQIANLISAQEKEMPLQLKLNHVARYMAIIALIFSLLSGLVFIARHLPLDRALFVDALLIVIALAVSAFPEGLPVTLITTLSSGAYRMAKKNAVVNRMSIIETLGETTVICADKTGTITKGEMTVKQVYASQKLYQITGSGYATEGQFNLDSRPANPKKDPTVETLCKAAVLCNDSSIARTDDDQFSIIGTPTEAALAILAAKAGFYKESLQMQRLDEIPFSSERKLMSVLVKEGQQTKIYVKGAPELILDRCTTISSEGKIRVLTAKEKSTILSVITSHNEQAFRTVALAYKSGPAEKSHFESGLTFLGLAIIEDPPRAEVAQSIKLCLKAGISVKMITGDNKETALSIAQQVGLEQKVLVGTQLDKFTDEELASRVLETTIFARVRPEHKLRIVNALKSHGEVVTMTGDGVNDAPALKSAHIGVAMGKVGTDVTREVSDLILKDDNFATIVSAVAEGRSMFSNMRKFIAYQLSCNYAEIGIIFLGILLGLPLPLVAIQILFMNLVTDDIPAITLGLNKSSPDSMSRPPRRKSTILTRQTLTLAVLTGTIMGLGTLAVFIISLNVLHYDEVHARTVALVTLILFEIANAFNFRSFRKLVFTRSPLVNPYLVTASVISILATLAIVYTPLSAAFETVPLTALDWLIAFIPALLVIVALDITKKLNNTYGFWKDD